jgi:hypothetical protein
VGDGYSTAGAGHLRRRLSGLGVSILDGAGIQGLDPAGAAEHERLLGGFLRALKDGDLEGMVKLLARDATLYSDGGGKARAALKPVPGGDSVARFLLGIWRQAPPTGRPAWSRSTANPAS